MNVRPTVLFAAAVLFCSHVNALSMAPEEFQASRQMACVLAQQSLGQLSEEEYGSRTHTVLDGFEGAERTTILAKALGYFDGLMFDIADTDDVQVSRRLEVFVGSDSCQRSYQEVIFRL